LGYKCDYSESIQHIQKTVHDFAAASFNTFDDAPCTAFGNFAPHDIPANWLADASTIATLPEFKRGSKPAAGSA